MSEIQNYQPKVGLIEVPEQVRRRRSSVPPEAAKTMASMISDGWVSDNVAYQTRKKATSVAQAYRREVAKILGIELSSVGTRVFDRDGRWYFALRRRDRE